MYIHIYIICALINRLRAKFIDMSKRPSIVHPDSMDFFSLGQVVDPSILNTKSIKVLWGGPSRILPTRTLLLVYS